MRTPVEDVEHRRISVHLQELLADHRGAVPVAERVRGPRAVPRVPDVPHRLLPVDEAGVHRVPEELTPRLVPEDPAGEAPLAPPAAPAQAPPPACPRGPVP